MKFFVAIDAPSRYSRPPFGRFAYVQSQGRLVWRKETTESITRLVDLTNEALAFLSGKTGQYKLGLYPWKDVPQAEAPGSQTNEEPPPPAEPIPEETAPLQLGQEDQRPEGRKLQVKRKT